MLKKLYKEGLTTNSTRLLDNRLGGDFSSRIKEDSLCRTAMRMKVKDASNVARENERIFNLEKRKLEGNKEERRKRIKICEKLMEKERKKVERSCRDKIKNIKKKEDRKKKMEEKEKSEDKSDRRPKEMTKFSDLEIYRDIDDEWKKEVNTEIIKGPPVRGAELHEDEQEVLKLPPKFCLEPKLDEEEFILELEKMNTKLRYDGKGKHKEDFEEEKEEKDEEEKKIEEISDILEMETRKIFDEENMTLDMRKQRVTDMKGNTNVKLPPPPNPHPRK